MTYDIDTNSVSATPWNRVDKAGVRGKFVKALNEGAEGVEAVVREFYAGVLGESIKDAPSANWVLPHHELRGSSVVLNREGLGAAAGRLDQVNAPREKIVEMAKHLARHYRQIDAEIPDNVAQYLSGSARLDVTGSDGTYYYSDQPVALICSGKRYGKESGRQDFSGVTKDEVLGMVKNWVRMGKPELPVELSGHGEPMCAGFIYDLWAEDCEDGESMLMSSIKWTATAAHHITLGELPGMSVEILRNVKDVTTGAELPGWSLHAAAVLTRPFYDDLPRVSLGSEMKCGITIAEFTNEYRVALSRSAETPDEDENMDKRILELLGLNEGATADEAVAKLTALKQDLSAAGKRVTDLEATNADTSTKLTALQKEDHAGTVAVLQASLRDQADKVVSLTAKLNEMQSVALEKDCREFIALGQKEGRIPTKDEDVALWKDQFTANPDKARKLLATIPASKVTASPTGIAVSDDNATDEGDAKLLAAAKNAGEVANLAATLQQANPKLTIADAQRHAAAQLAAGR